KMELSLANLPFGIREAYLGCSPKPDEIERLREIGAKADLEAVAIVDHANAIIYLTRDGGHSFEVERIAESIQLKGHQFPSEGVVVRRVLRISELPGSN